MKRPLSINITTARKRKGLTQEQQAKALKMDRPRYAAYEEDRAEPHYDLVKTIMDFHGIKEEDMYPFIFNKNFWKE
jgi:transcriptional regulator with XRE-family HTH domain